MRVHQSGVYRCDEQVSCSELLWVWVVMSRGGSRKGSGVSAVEGRCGAVK